MKKIGKILILLLLVLILSGAFSVFVGCNKTHTVKFDLNGGTATIPNQTIKNGQKAVRPTAQPTKANFIFDNWYDSLEENAAKFDFDKAITTEITIYAKYNAATPATFAVNFVTGTGGSTIAAQQVASGAFATAPATDPTREGYTFTGWFTEEGGSVPFNFDTSAINMETNVYAGWQAIEEPDEEDDEEDEEPIANPTRRVAALRLANAVLETTAESAANYSSYTSNSGSANTANNTASTANNTANIVNNTANTARNNANNQVAKSGTSNRINNGGVVAKNNAAFYNINYNLGENGTGVQNTTAVAGGYATRPSENPSRRGYRFNGWFAEADAKTPFDFENTKVGADTNVYAGWTSEAKILLDAINRFKEGSISLKIEGAVVINRANNDVINRANNDSVMNYDANINNSNNAISVDKNRYDFNKNSNAAVRNNADASVENTRNYETDKTVRNYGINNSIAQTDIRNENVEQWPDRRINKRNIGIGGKRGMKRGFRQMDENAIKEMFTVTPSSQGLTYKMDTDLSDLAGMIPLGNAAGSLSVTIDLDSQDNIKEIDIIADIDSGVFDSEQGFVNFNNIQNFGNNNLGINNYSYAGRQPIERRRGEIIHGGVRRDNRRMPQPIEDATAETSDIVRANNQTQNSTMQLRNYSRDYSDNQNRRGSGANQGVENMADYSAVRTAPQDDIFLRSRGAENNYPKNRGGRKAPQAGLDYSDLSVGSDRATTNSAVSGNNSNINRIDARDKNAESNFDYINNDTNDMVGLGTQNLSGEGRSLRIQLKLRSGDNNMNIGQVGTANINNTDRSNTGTANINNTDRSNTGTQNTDARSISTMEYTGSADTTHISNRSDSYYSVEPFAG